MKAANFGRFFKAERSRSSIYFFYYNSWRCLPVSRRENAPLSVNPQGGNPFLKITAKSATLCCLICQQKTPFNLATTAFFLDVVPLTMISYESGSNSKIYFRSQWKLYYCNRRINAHMSIKDSWAISFVRENSTSSFLILRFFFLTAKRRSWSILIVLLNVSRLRRRWYSHLYWLIRVSGKYPLKVLAAPSGQNYMKRVNSPIS